VVRHQPLLHLGHRELPLLHLGAVPRQALDHAEAPLREVALHDRIGPGALDQGLVDVGRAAVGVDEGVRKARVEQRRPELGRRGAEILDVHRDVVVHLAERERRAELGRLLAAAARDVDEDGGGICDGIVAPEDAGMQGQHGL